MRLHSITLKDYRGVADRHIDFNDQGITVIAGPNQSGKSSVIEACELVLTEKATSQRKEVKAVHRSGVDRPAVVELDATIGAERFTLRKEFGGSKHKGTTLIFADQQRKALYGDAAHNHVQELLHDHEDTALFEALTFLQGEDLSSFELTDGQSALQKALDAATSSQNDSMSGDDILAAVQAEFGRYFTPTGQVTKERKEAAARQKELAQEVAELENRIQETEGVNAEVKHLAERCKALTARIAQEEENEQQLSEQTITWEKWQQARQAKLGQIDTVKAQLDAAQAAMRADKELEQQHIAVRERIAGIEQQLKELPQEDEGVLPQLQCERNKLKETVETATRDREIMALLERERDWQKADTEARTLKNAVEEAKKSCDDIPHDPEVYQQADKLRTKIEGLQQALTSSAGTITVAPAPGGDVRCNGSPLTAAMHDTLAQPFTIEVPGHVTITLQPPAEAAELHEQVARLQGCYDALLAQLHVADWNSAVAQEKAWKEAAEKYGATRAELRAFENRSPESRRLEEQQRLTQDYARYPSDLLDAGRNGTLQVLTAADVEELRAAYTEASERFDAVQRSHQLSSQRRDLLTEQLAQAKAEQEQLSPLVQEDINEHVARRDTLTKQLTEQQEELATEEEKYAGIADPTAALQKSRSSLAQLRESAEEVERRYQWQQGVLDTHLSAGYRSVLEEKRAQAQDLDEEIKRATAAAEAVRLLRDTLSAARERATAHYQTPYVETLTRLGKRVWGEHFVVTVDDKLKILTAVTRPNSTPIDYQDLSVGTQEQLAVLSRLACYQLVEKGQVPVIFDDILGYSDPERREDMAKAIEMATRVDEEDAAPAGQLIIFTCDSSRFATLPGKHYDWSDEVEPEPA